MAFKENLLQKLRIDELSRKILDSLGTPESAQRMDKAATRELLEIGSFQVMHLRDLELYFLDAEASPPRILVLDNELPIYRTTPEDVALRKSPTIKEMISIRNAIRILNDAGVVTSKKADSVAAVRKICIDSLDLHFTSADIETIVKDGSTSLAGGDADGVVESLRLFGELLGFQESPKLFSAVHHRILGKVDRKTSGEVCFGPAAAYAVDANRLMYFPEPICSGEKSRLANYRGVLAGEEKASMEGVDVFEKLRAEAPSSGVVR